MNKLTKLRTTLAMLGLAVLGSVANAGTFKDISTPETPANEKWIAYEGQIVDADVPVYEKLLQREETIVLIMKSGGGSFAAGVRLGRLTMKYRDEVEIIVDKAYSAAALWTIGDDNYKFLDDKSELGFHLPYIYGSALDAGTEQQIGYICGRYLEDALGENTAMNLMQVMGEIRREYGKMALIVMSPTRKPFVKK